MARRASASQRGYDSAWSRASKAFLAAHPRCCIPGCTTAAAHVDHHPPHRGNRQAFWDCSTWRPMCGPHHAQQTARHDGGFGRRPNGGDIAHRGATADGRPRDPNHPWNRDRD